MEKHMEPDRTFPRAERLRGRMAVDALFAGGQSGYSYPLRYVWQLDETGEAPVSVLITAPKRNHKRAVKRNLLKRRTREAYRLGKTPLVEAMQARGGTLHLALLYSSKEVEPFARIENAVQTILAQVRDSL